MREHLGFLRISSAVVKVAAWIFLLFGVLSGISSFIEVAGRPRWIGVAGLVVYTFLFFFFFLIAKIADLMIKIIHEIKKEEN